MKIFNKTGAVAFATALMLSLSGPVTALAATAPSLGSESTYGVVSTTHTNSNTGLQTIINGDICATTHDVPLPLTVTGATDTPCAPLKGTDQSAALAILNGQACTAISGTLNAVVIGSNPAGTFPPGCYAVTGAMDITTGTSVTLDAAALSGDGGNVWIFKSSGGFTTGASTAGFPSVVLANGASASNVFWAPAGATTLGANFASSVTPTFVGNILDAAGISIGHFATLLGRALAFGGTVLTDSNTITVPTTLRVIKTVINDDGGTATSSNFTVNVKLSGVDVSGSPAAGTSTPGRLYTLVSGTYVVSEVANPSYTQTFSGDCNAGGSVTLATGDNKTCTITNNDIAGVSPSPSSGGKRDGTITVVKTVINNSGGTKTVADFPLFVDGRQVVSGETNNFDAPHDGYMVSETSSANYVRSFSGDCDENGRFNLTGGQNQACVITNDDIGPAAAVVPPLIDVVKVPSPLSLPAGAGPVTYTYTLRNIGAVPVTNITMVGDTCRPIVLATGDTNGDSKLDLNEVWVYRCTTTLSQTHTNTVVATGQANGLTATDIASATVVVGAPVVPPLIHVVKNPSSFVLPYSGAVTYTFIVTNPGTVPLSNVSVVDNKCGPISGRYGDLNSNNMLDVSETWLYFCTKNLTTNTVNTAKATGSANGLTATDFSLATVVVSTPVLPNSGLPGDKSDKGMNRGQAMSAFRRSLSLGLEGVDVEALQTALEHKGLLKMPNGVAKGFFGPLTRAAIMKYQTSMGLPSVGIFGPMTRAKLISELSE